VEISQSARGEAGPAGAPPASPKPFQFPYAAAALVALLAICTAVVVRLVNRAGHELPMFRVDAARAELLASPDWLPSEWLDEARGAIAAHGAFSIFSDAELAGIRADLESLPWVKGVHEVERALPRTVRLAVTPRSPVASVECGGSLVLVDEESIVLPVATFAADRIAAMPRIVRWRGEFSPPRIGQAWNDPAVQDGVSVALTIPKFRATLPGIQVAKIDVTNSGGKVDPRESELLLVTPQNVKIKWGRAPRTHVFGELPVEAKLENLARVDRKFPGLRGVSVVNLRYDEPDIFDDQGQWVQRPTAMAPPPEAESQR
jgi:hypothetical protein